MNYELIQNIAGIGIIILIISICVVMQLWFNKWKDAKGGKDEI